MRVNCEHDNVRAAEDVLFRLLNSEAIKRSRSLIDLP